MTESPLYTITVKSTAVLAEKRFVDTDGDYPAAKARSFGVTRVAADTIGDNVGVHTLGTAIVEAGAAIAVGEAVEVVGAVGKAGPFTDGIKVAIALTAASADEDLIEVYLLPNA